jgi:hypothetical protein
LRVRLDLGWLAACVQPRCYREFGRRESCPRELARRRLFVTTSPAAQNALRLAPIAANTVTVMPKSKSRKPIRSVAKAARHKKVLFLPLDRESVAQIAIQVRMALEVARAGQGDAGTLRCLAQAVALTGLIAGAGHGVIEEETLRVAEVALSGVLASGSLSGWGLDARELAGVTDVINEHDRQLRETRLDLVVRAFEQIERRLGPGLTLAELFALRDKRASRK